MAPYPTEEDLNQIRTWYFGRVRELFDFIENQDSMQEYGSLTRTIMPDGNERIRIATGGWSGNEDIIAALQQNHIIHGSYWKMSARGGLEIYIIPAPKEADNDR